MLKGLVPAEQPETMRACLMRPLRLVLQRVLLDQICGQQAAVSCGLSKQQTESLLQKMTSSELRYTISKLRTSIRVWSPHLC